MRPYSCRRAVLTLAAALVIAVSSGLLSAQSLSGTPTEVFLAYRQSLAGAKSYDAILPYMDARSRGMVENMTDEMRAGVFELLKKFEATYSDVAVAGEDAKGETVVLSLTGKDPKGQPAKGTVPMSKEAGGWKVGAEKWSSRPR
jgi:hypothetical protein